MIFVGAILAFSPAPSIPIHLVAPVAFLGFGEHDRHTGRALGTCRLVSHAGSAAGGKSRLGEQVGHSVSGRDAVSGVGARVHSTDSLRS